MIKRFNHISFSHLPRENNLIPNALAMLATLFKVEPGIEVEPIRTKLQSELAYCAVTEETDERPWFHDIKTYIQKNKYLEEDSNNDRKTIRRLAMGFFLDEEVLYKRNHNITLLQSVEVQEER
ncbi:uncharacterized protein LOC131163409 [Malania oleifera]|uniref:uncharacterized protein LOC131163409 n=1 Tax=Malania oleifera TaxID=397392 RepID=UPI0025AE6422|nr:uncharacterized protein LOC131163409 [Malania oleifera]